MLATWLCQQVETIYLPSFLTPRLKTFPSIPTSTQPPDLSENYHPPMSSLEHVFSTAGSSCLQVKGRQVLLSKFLTDSLLNKAQRLNLAFGSTEALTLLPRRCVLDLKLLLTTTSWESYRLFKAQPKCCFPQHISSST